LSVLFLLLGKGGGFVPPLFFCLNSRVINFFVYIYISNNHRHRHNDNITTTIVRNCKKHQPYYNNLLKADNSYTYIKITKEDFPQILLTKQRHNDGIRYLITPEGVQQYMILKKYPCYSNGSSDTQPTHKYKDDEIKELKEEIIDDCFECKEHKLIKFTSILTVGKNYCKECIVKENNKELLEELY
jgi:hypothetical protein